MSEDDRFNARNLESSNKGLSKEEELEEAFFNLVEKEQTEGLNFEENENKTFLGREIKKIDAANAKIAKQNSIESAQQKAIEDLMNGVN